MIQTKLKVSQSRKGLVGFITLFASIEAGMIFVSLVANPSDVLLCRVLFTAFFVIWFSVLLTSLLFKVQVIDSTISVRTQIGRCFSFTVSEITKIACDICYNSEDRQVGVIIIEIASRKFKIEQIMDGFQEMTGYILEKLESGEINETAVSAQCKRKLNKYKSAKKMLK